MNPVISKRRISRTLSIIGCAALIVLAVFMGFYNLDGYLMNDDEGDYLYDAWRISLGEVPYRDFFVAQTPLSFFLTAVLFKIFAASVWGARALSYLFILGAAYLIYRASRKFFYFNHNLSLLAAAVFLFTKHIYFMGRTFMPESSMLFFSTAALFFALKAEAGPQSQQQRWALFLFGVFSGLAALAKLNAVLLIGGYALFLSFLLFRRFDNPRSIVKKALLSAAGFSLTFGLVYILMLIFVPGTYRATLGFHLAKEKTAAASFVWLVLTRLVQFVGNHNYGLVLLAVAGMFFVPVFKGRKRSLLFFMALAALAQVFIPGTFYLRYAVFALVPLTFFFGDGLAGIGSLKKSKSFLGPVAAAIILLCLAPSFNLKKLHAFDKDTRALAAYVRDSTAAGDYVFGDNPGINFLARRSCPPRLVDVSRAMTRSGQITAADIRNECELYQVKLILVEKGPSAHHLKNLKDYSRFQAYLNEFFDFVRTMPRQFLQVDVYRRKVKDVGLPRER